MGKKIIEKKKENIGTYGHIKAENLFSKKITFQEHYCLLSISGSLNQKLGIYMYDHQDHFSSSLNYPKSKAMSERVQCKVNYQVPQQFQKKLIGYSHIVTQMMLKSRQVPGKQYPSNDQV